MFRLFLVSICVAGALVAQDPQPGADVTIDAAERSELTDNVRMALSQASFSRKRPPRWSKLFVNISGTDDAFGSMETSR